MPGKERGNGDGLSTASCPAALDEAKPLLVKRRMAPSPRKSRWFSSVRMQSTWVGLLAVPAVTFSTCYGLWLLDGCGLWMPFPSDLGLHGAARPLFAAGVLSTASLAVLVSADAWFARRWLLRADRSHFTAAMNMATLVSSLVFAAGLVASALTPWDLSFGPHTAAKLIIVISGLAAQLCNVVILRRVGSELGAMRPDHNCWATLCQALLFLIALSSFAMVLAAHAHPTGPQLSEALLHSPVHWEKYCGASGTRMLSSRLNMAATWETVIFTSLIASMATLREDIMAYHGCAFGYAKVLEA